MSGYSLGAPVALDPRISLTRVTPVATADGGSVAWEGQLPFPPGTPVLLTAAVDASADSPRPKRPPTVSPDRRRRGRRIYRDRPSRTRTDRGSTAGLATPVNVVAVLPANRGALEPSPLRRPPATPLGQSLFAFTAAVPATGRGVALAWQDGRTGAIDLATWSP